MLKLRPYKACDAQTILSWCKDEVSFRKWTSDRYDSYPITAEDMNHKYIDLNGDCPDEDNFYAMTAFDESGVMGSIILRYTDEARCVVRLGFVIVDDSKRGRGYGKGMIVLALKYAFELLGAQKVTIGVFDNNAPALHCYRAAGFREVESADKITCSILGEEWAIIELEIDKDTIIQMRNKSVPC